MSLLDKANETIIVYPEVTTIDEDGNIFTRPSATGITARATLQLSLQSGTSARRAEQDNEGFESEEVYRLRFSRAEDRRLGPLGPQSRISWNGEYWEIYGYHKRFNGSKRTRHRDYTIRRS